MSRIPITVPYTGGINLTIDNETKQLYVKDLNNSETVIENGKTNDIYYWTDSSSKSISTIFGGKNYKLLAPISELNINTIQLSPENSYIYCNFSGGSTLNLPQNIWSGNIQPISSGFYRIDIKNRNIDVIPLTYNGSTGIIRSSGGSISSTWYINGQLVKNSELTTVYDGGLAISTWVTSNSTSGYGHFVMSGGYASKIVVSNGGMTTIESGANAFNVTVSSGGYLGTFRMDSTMYWDEIKNGQANIADKVDIVGTSMCVHESGTISNITISSGQTLELYLTHCYANNITILQNGRLDFDYYDEDFETRDFTILTGENTNINSGTFYYRGEGPVGGECVNGSFTNLSGTYRVGIGSGITVLNPEVGTFETSKTRIYVFSGGLVSGGTIGPSGDIDVFPSGLVKDITIGGYVAPSRIQTGICLYGGSAKDIIVSSNGYLTCYSAGLLTGSAIIYSGASMKVYHTAAAGTIVMSGGTTSVYDTGTVESVSVLNGTLSAYGSCSMGNITISSGGSLVAYGSTNINTVNIDNGVGNIYNTATITNLDITNTATVSIYNSAFVENLTVSNGATLVVPNTTTSGVSITNLNIISGNGGNANSRFKNVTISSAIISAGKMYITLNAYVSSVELIAAQGGEVRPILNLYSGTISNFIENTLGSVYANKGIFSNFTQNDGIFNCGTDNIIYGGTIIGSEFSISSGTTAYNITKVVGGAIDPNKMVIYINNGGLISGLNINDSRGESTDDIIVTTATSSNSLQQYGVVFVYSGGILYDTQMTNIIISNGGLVSNVNPVKVMSSGIETYVGKIYVKSGGTLLGVPNDFIATNVSAAAGAIVNGVIQ